MGGSGSNIGSRGKEGMVWGGAGITCLRFRELEF